MPGPCTPYVETDSWTSDPRLCGVAITEVDGVNPGDAYTQRASEALWKLLGSQFPGECSATVRPILKGDGCCPGWPSFTSSLFGAGGCEDGNVIPLHNPVREITEVRVNGEVFDGWYLRSGYLLVRSDGYGWPTSQKVHLPATDPGTFAITYKYGAHTPLQVEAATRELAVHLWNEDHPKPGKALPAGATSASRQGMSVSVDRDIERLRQAGPSLPAVMAAIASWNPTGQRLPPDVWSPDDAWDLIVATRPVPVGS